jgi:hypothetical protein
VGHGPHGVCCRVSVDTDCRNDYQIDIAVVMLEKAAVLPINSRRFFRTAPRRGRNALRRNFRKIPVSTVPVFERHRRAVFGLAQIAATFDFAPTDVRSIALVFNFKKFSSASACCNVWTIV